MAPPVRHSGKNGLHTPSDRRVEREGGLGEGRSAGLQGIGRRFARRPNALKDRNWRLRFRFAKKNRQIQRQEADGHHDVVGWQRLSY